MRTVEHHRPRERPDVVFIIHPKSGEEVWIPLFNAGEPLFPELMARLGAIKRGRIGGLLIVGAWGTRPPGCQCLGSPGPATSRTGATSPRT